MAKKQAEIVEPKSKLQDTLDRLDKAYGVGTVLTLDGKTSGNYDVISSGSLGFDYITLGIGGFARGKLYELMGWEGVGKSTVAGHAVAECQKVGKVALYIDGEHALDKEYFQALGVDTSKMLIAQPSCGEEGFNIALQMIKSGEVDLVIIDSDSSLIPKAVVDGEVGDSAIGKKARLNNNAYPTLKAALVKHHVCVIVISQYREKIGVMFGNPTTTQGGHALKFYTDCRLEISRSGFAKEGEVIEGSVTKIKATKNKMSSPYRQCTFDIVYGKGIDVYKELVELATEHKLIQRAGSWYSYEGTKLGQGTTGAEEMLKDNPELFDLIKEKTILAIHGNVEPTPLFEDAVILFPETLEKLGAE